MFYFYHHSLSLSSKNASGCFLSIGSGVSEWGRSKTNALVTRVENGIEAFEESKTVDEIESLASRSAETVNNKIYVPTSAANESVERPWPRLRVGSQHKSTLIGTWCQMQRTCREWETHCRSYEGEVFHFGELGGGQTQQTSITIVDTAGQFCILAEGSSSKEHEGGTGIDDTGCGWLDSSRAILDTLVNSPKFACGRSSCYLGPLDSQWRNLWG